MIIMCLKVIILQKYYEGLGPNGKKNCQHTGEKYSEKHIYQTYLKKK